MEKQEAMKQFDDSVEAAKSALFDAGASSVVVEPKPVDGAIYTEEQLQAKIAEALASAGDTTPYSQEQMDSVRAEMAKVQSDLDLAKADDEQDESKIAAQQGILDQIAALVKGIEAPKPVEPSVPSV